jgi:aminoglycoside phosphotransferase family enzyme
MALGQALPSSSGVPDVQGLADKVRLLSSPGTYGHTLSSVDARETHMAWVFLTGSRAYKLKKPVRTDFLDYGTIAARRRALTAELRLNGRLAGRTYLGLVPLCADAHGELHLGGDGRIVDWVLEMVQLPASEMMDRRIGDGRFDMNDAVRLGRHLAAFYARCRPQRRDGWAYLRHLSTEQAANWTLLARPDLLPGADRAVSILRGVDDLLARHRAAIGRRVESGRVVEAHGDLRPEHVCLLDPPLIFDCLEFDRDMRLLDPYDEINYLGLECDFLGAGWVRPVLLSTLEAAMGDRPPTALMATYGAFRCVLRARISLAHLLDQPEQTHERWRLDARRYLAMAEVECARAGAAVP